MKPAMDTMNATERKQIRSLNQGRSLLEYAAPALALGQSIIFFLGVMTVLTMILAFVIIVRMFRRLESYRAEKAKNRELISMEEAARTLAHEMKNPLGVIMMRCALVKRNASLETVAE